MMSGRLLLARGAVPDGIVCGPRAAPLSIGVVATYPPRICGIATFTQDLVRAVGQSSHGARLRVAAMTRPPGDTAYPAEVNIQIRQDAIGDYAAAAAALNRTADVVCLQHEFGIFGGPDGAYVLDLLHRLTTPIVTTLHTILHQPTAGQRQVLRQIAEVSATVVVMSETARDFLTDLYGISPRSVSVIPHGVPPQPFGDTAAAKSALGLSARKVVLTFGLLSANKGIEMMLRSLPAVIRAHPDLLYIVLGESHPLALSGGREPYVDGLKRLVCELGIEANVAFETRFVDTAELCVFLRSADVYVTPYLNEEQITSGTLSFAMGSGIASVSTPYWYAREMLAEGRGRLVPFGDVTALGTAVSDLLSDDAARNEIRARAYAFSRAAVWSNVGARYLRVFEDAARATRGYEPAQREIAAIA
jgi:glycosyltransferase involved in cell wall biosynthesis